MLYNVIELIIIWYLAQQKSNLKSHFSGHTCNYIKNNSLHSWSDHDFNNNNYLKLNLNNIFAPIYAK